MSSSTPSPADVLDVFDSLRQPGTPYTTTEIGQHFECTDRTVYNKLETLVEEGHIETKKVGARGRVWWRPLHHQKRIMTDSAPGTSLPTDDADWWPTALGSDGEMAERIRKSEWSETPLGPIAEWPRELQVAIDIMLGAREAIGIYWGADRTLLYNDAAKAKIRQKHPDALGQPGREVFPETWETLGPIYDHVISGNGPVRQEELYLPLERAGETEDFWWDSSFNPIPVGDGSVGGVFNISVDVTDRVLAERELRVGKERLDVALDAAEMGTWEWDLEARAVTADEIMLSLFDLPETDDPVPVERFLERMSLEGVSQCETVMESAFEPGEEIQDDIRLGHVEDPPRWVTWRGRAAANDPSRLRGISFDVTERKQAELEREAMREQLASDLVESEEQLAAELSAARELQGMSTRLIQEDDVDALYDGILDAAVAIMDTDYASMQKYHEDRSELELLAHWGFSPEAAEFWKRVDPESRTTYGVALETGERAIATDVETDEFMAGTDDREMLLRNGIHAIQTTPLVSRNGELIGMISTHWETPHEPAERNLRLLDVLARQAADLIEHRQSEEELRESEAALERLNDAGRELIDATPETIRERTPEVVLSVLDVEYATLVVLRRDCRRTGRG